MVVGESSEVCSNWTSPVTLDSPRKTATIKKKGMYQFQLGYLPGEGRGDNLPARTILFIEIELICPSLD